MTLTERAMALRADGLTNREIAARLQTTANSVAVMLWKVHARSRASLEKARLDEQREKRRLAVCALRAEGKKLKEISAALCLPIWRISELLAASGMVRPQTRVVLLPDLGPAIFDEADEADREAYGLHSDRLLAALRRSGESCVDVREGRDVPLRMPSAEFVSGCGSSLA